MKRTLEEYKDYIAGLFEGDGHVSIANPMREKQHVPRWHITGHVKDMPCLEHLRGILGHGFIRLKRQENAAV